MEASEFSLKNADSLALSTQGNLFLNDRGDDAYDHVLCYNENRQFVKGGSTMAERSKRAIRRMECPEGRGTASLLLESRVERGKKVLHSIS